jgi:hypothetical protein
MPTASSFSWSLHVIRIMLVLLVGAGLAVVHPAWGDNFGAIAYSPATRQYGYSYKYSSRAKAESVALAHCKAADARIVAWVQDNWWCCLALDLDAGAYGWGWGQNLSVARSKAQEAIARDSTNYYIAVAVSADGSVREYTAPMSFLYRLPKPKKLPELPSAFFPTEEP